MPSSSTTTVALFSSLTIARTPIQWRKPLHGLDEPRPPHRPVLVAQRRRERDRVLDRRRLDHEAAVLVVLEAPCSARDRIDHVRVLRLVEEAVDEPHRVQAEVLADRRRVEPGAAQDLRRVQRAARDDDRARAHGVPLAVGVDVLDAGRLRRPRRARARRSRSARSSSSPRAQASGMYVFIVDLPALVGQPCRHEPQRMQLPSVYAVTGSSSCAERLEARARRCGRSSASRSARARRAPARPGRSTGRGRRRANGSPSSFVRPVAGVPLRDVALVRAQRDLRVDRRRAADAAAGEERDDVAVRQVREAGAARRGRASPSPPSA